MEDDARLAHFDHLLCILLDPYNYMFDLTIVFLRLDVLLVVAFFILPKFLGERESWTLWIFKMY